MASIRQRSKNSWLLRVELGYNADGTRNQPSKTIKVTDPALLRAPKRLQDHLNEELYKFKAEVEAGTYHSPGKMTFEAFEREWDRKYVEVDLEETTKDNYRHYMTRRILPHFKHMYMEKIKPMHILDFLDILRRPDARLDKSGPLGSASIVIIYRVLRSFFNKAVEWRVLSEHPMNGIKKPKEDDVKEMEVYDETEIKLLFEALEHEDLRTRACILLAFVTGMRRGEIAGLEWHRISFETNSIYIARNLPKVKNGKPVLKAPKNKKTRRIKMSASLAKELLLLKEARDEEKELVDQVTERQFVFCHPDGKHYHPQWFTNKWIDFHRRHDLKPIRLHDLRHTSVSWMIFKRIHSETIARRVGHSSLKLLQRYGHIFNSVDDEAAASFDDI